MNKQTKATVSGLKFGKLKTLFLTFAMVVSFGAYSHAAIVINEVLAVNTSTITDPYGDFSDYIELHNNGTTAVDISGYLVFNGVPFWTIPSGTTIPAGGYRILWCNDRDEAATFSTNFKLDAAGENVTLRDPGFVQIDTVTYPTAIADESYGRFPNGTGPFERMDTPTPNSANVTNGTSNNPDHVFLKINEVVTVNNTGIQDEDGFTADWIEIYNTHTIPVNTLGLRIEDNNNQWVFPSLDIPAGGFLTVFASGKDRTTLPLHTNFQLSSSGETVKLLSVDGTVTLNTVVVPAIVPDNSWGPFPDGTTSYIEMQSTTPGAANSNTPIVNNPNHVFIVINEINANNASGLRSNIDNDYYDWIELYNTAAVPVDLDGIRLADAERVWAHPPKVLNPSEYAVVYASGLDVSQSGENHTNFSVSSTFGEVIQLLNKDSSNLQTVIVPSGIGEDVTYARFPNATGNFVVAPDAFQSTPLAANVPQNPPAPNPNAQFIVINELMSNNSTGLQDEDNDYPDWIELYNTSNTVAVDLTGLKLRETGLEPETWVFPAVTMQPNSYLIVFASNKNRLSPTLHTNFELSSAGETLEFRNLNNAVIQSVTFPALSPNEAYAKLPNGTGPFQALFTPTPGAVNSNNPPAANPDAGLITVNEVQTNQTIVLQDEDGDYSDWIELHNTSSTVTVDLSGLKLGDGSNTWTIPNGVTLGPKQYKVIFASGKNRTNPANPLHTNFQLDSAGETVFFLNTDSTTVEQLIVPALQVNKSYGHLPNATGPYKVMCPTPNKVNLGCLKKRLVISPPIACTYVLATGTFTCP